MGCLTARRSLGKAPVHPPYWSAGLTAENTCTVTTNRVKQSTFTVHRIENLTFWHWSSLTNPNTRIITGLTPG